jgi:hypothetical protein
MQELVGSERPLFVTCAVDRKAKTLLSFVARHRPDSAVVHRPLGPGWSEVAPRRWRGTSAGSMASNACCRNCQFELAFLRVP